MSDDLLERLADKEHASWARWMGYLFSLCTHHPDNSATIPSWAVERWMRQAATAYEDLEEGEKESDRAEVRRILPIIAAAYGRTEDVRR